MNNLMKACSRLNELFLSWFFWSAMLWFRRPCDRIELDVVKTRAQRLRKLVRIHELGVSV